MDVSEDTVVSGGDDVSKFIVADVKERVSFIAKSLQQRELRYAVRAVRSINALKKHVSTDTLAQVIKASLPAAEARRLCAFIDVSVDEGEAATGSSEGSSDGDGANSNNDDRAILSGDSIPTASAFLQTLIALHLTHSNNYTKAKEVVDDLVAQVESIERREASPILSRAYFAYARVYELLGTPAAAKSVLNKALRTQTLQQNTLSQAVIVNCLLRIYFLTNLFDQAEMLLSKVAFPDTAPTAEMARYMYYLGYSKAVQLEYTDAHHYLLQATRKAPDSAVGFLQHANKVLVIVQMLLGEIPDRSVFKKPYLKKPLEPYFHLAKAVRCGEVGAYANVVEQFRTQFVADKTFNLVLRLRQSVIKAGVRTICLSYSRISLADMASKLGLDSAEDAEYVVAKSVRDGVVDATIDHENKWVTSKDVLDIYSTTTPQEAFHRRISFCMRMHQDALKAMRYPPDLHRIKAKKAGADDAALVDKELEEAELDDDDFDEGDDILEE